MNKSREQWEAERDLAIINGNDHYAEWIDRKILYPIGNLINGRYPGDEKFECSRVGCKSHVGVRYEKGGDKQCIVCGFPRIDITIGNPMFITDGFRV